MQLPSFLPFSWPSGANKEKITQIGIFLLLLLVSIVPKLYNLENPALNDLHFYRQLTTFSISQRFTLGEGSLLYPSTYQAINPQDEQHLDLAEFPVYQLLVSWLFQVTGISVLTVRLFNIFLSTCLTFVIYFIGKRLHSSNFGALAATVFCLFPAIVFWGRVDSPEIFGLLCALSAIALALYGVKDAPRLALFTTLFTLAALTKPFYLSFLPLCMYLFQVSNNVPFKKILWVLILPIISVIVWRLWALHFVYGNWIVTDHSLWLLHNNQGWLKYFTESRWITQFFQQFFIGMLLTPLGGVLAICGFVLSSNFFKKPFAAFVTYYAMCSALNYIVVAAGSTWHDYYNLHWVPMAALCVAISLWRLSSFLQQYAKSHLKFPLTPHHFYEWYFFMVGVFIAVIFSAFAGVTEFFAIRQEYFGTQTLLGTPEYQADYDKITALLSPSDRLITIQYKLDSSMLIQMQRVGYVIEYGHYSLCLTDPELLQEIANRSQDLKPRYILIDQTSNPESKCSLQNADKLMQRHYPMVFKGEHIRMYKIF